MSVIDDVIQQLIDENKRTENAMVKIVKLEADLAITQEALNRFASIDLTKPVDPKIVYDILHARAVLAALVGEK